MNAMFAIPSRGLLGFSAACGLFLTPIAAQAGPLHAISIGSIKTTKACTTYVMASSKSTLAVNRNNLYAADSWRTWLAKDCVNNFATMRSSIEAALASSGKFSVGSGGYKVDLTVSDVGTSSSSASNTSGYTPESYQISSSATFVNVDVNIRDRAGHIIYGGVLTKKIETATSSEVGEFKTSSSADGQGIYGALQNEVALAAARIVAFHIEPLRVINSNGRDMALNYGSPLLRLGSLIQVTSADSMTSIKYIVTSASDITAQAEKEGDGDVTRIGPDSRAVVLEDDDPTSNGRRTKREELP